MAIIKCPECGHQVSDMAPTCPSCGVQIAGKIIRCPECGEACLSVHTLCPSCHHPLSGAAPVEKPMEGEVNPSLNPAQNASLSESANDCEGDVEEDESADGGKKKKSYAPMIIGFVFAVVICGICLYFYSSANINKEREDYEFAMRSDDPLVLQQYLNLHKDANPEHRDSIQARFEMLQKIDEEWTNAVVSGSRDVLARYLQEHPDSKHKGEALDKIDSLDYVMADKAKTIEAYNNYLSLHPEGKYVESAGQAIKKLNETTVQPEEAQSIKTAFREFFKAINTRSEAALMATVAETMENFNGTQNAPKSVAAIYLRDQAYKESSKVIWALNDDHVIKKKVVGEGSYTYDVEFTATLDKESKWDGKRTLENYRIDGKIDTEGKITVLRWFKTN